MYDNCGEIENFSIWQMWRNLKFSFIKINKVCKWWGFIAIYAILLLNLLFTLFCREIYFATIYVLLCGEKLSPIVHLCRKNGKYQVCCCDFFVPLPCFCVSNFKMDTKCRIVLLTTLWRHCFEQLMQKRIKDDLENNLWKGLRMKIHNSSVKVFTKICNLP